MEIEAYTPLREQMGGRKKVAIIGFCGTSRDLTPYKDGSFEIWGLNRGYLFMERADRWFEMHNRNIIASQIRRPGKHIQWLNSFPGPVYMHQRFPEMPKAIIYPLKEMAAYFGENIFRIGTWGRPDGNTGTSGQGQWLTVTGEKSIEGEPYLSSSIAYEIALAIYEGFEEIHLYGVDLNTDAEYAWQKPGVEHLLGYAAGKGIKVVLPDNCPLLKGTLYGRGFLSERPEHMSYEQLEARITAIQKEMQGLSDELNKALGGHVERQFLMEQMMPGIDHELADKRHKQSQGIIANLQAKIEQCRGRYEETAYWLSQTMAGQQPTEAMLQIKEAYKEQLVSEGPQSDLEEIMEPPIPFTELRLHRNGNDPELAEAAVAPI